MRPRCSVVSPAEEMPFVILCGLPCSGKTTRAKQLKEFLESRENIKVNIVSDDDLKSHRNEIYADSKEEKNARGQLKSQVQRNINKETVTVLDSLNYIKGYRYELFCITKSCQTPQCVIHCDVNPDKARGWNAERPESESYSTNIFDALVMRFEPPESKNRWDSPLFVVHPKDELPCQQICDVLLKKKAPPPNLSTQSQPVSSSNFIHELDKVTQSVVSVVLEAQKTAVPGETITIPGATEQIILPKMLTLAELHRIRRQFISFTKTHPTEDTAKITNMFIQFINSSLK